MQTVETYILSAVTNLHPGSGQTDFGIIDKRVQRDPTSNLPVIFASSLKGAVREMFNTHPQVSGSDELEIFGSDVKGKLAQGNQPSQTKAKLQQGAYRFFDAHLIALPIRSSKNFFYLATCAALIQDFLDHLSLIGHPKADQYRENFGPLLGGSPGYSGTSTGEIRMEMLRLSPLQGETVIQAVGKLHTLLGTNRIAVLKAEDFQQLAKDLPTVARNHLDDGISDNLWYEEIIPRESRFYFSISRSGLVQGDPFDQALNTQFNHTIQIGANATVGYGMSKTQKI